MADRRKKRERLELQPIRVAKKVKLSFAKGKYPLHLDKRSYILVRIYFDKRELAVGRCTPGHLLTHEFRGKTAKLLCKEVLSSGLITRLDHAAYLGRELARAEAAMKDRKLKYVQDSA
jgi:tetrahydromethanopterin S-methyltransferase subunit A